MPCALCKNNTFSEIANKDAKTSESLHIVLCDTCGLIQQSPIPTEDELKIYYSHHYRLDYKKAYTPKPKHIYRSGKTALQRLQFLQQVNISKGRLLDIGAGGGEFVYLSSKQGFEAQGIEPNIGYSEYAEAEYCCRLETAELDQVQGRYDIITMFHVLEHLPSPVNVFERLHSLLNSQGVLFIEVPWIEAKDASPHNIFFKAHIFYFSVDTLIACASQYFDVIKIDTSSNLKILFRAKPVPSNLELPDSDSVKKLKEQLKNKGWLEYLFAGKGCLKFFKNILRNLEENKAKRLQPKEILDKMIEQN